MAVFTFLAWCHPDDPMPPALAGPSSELTDMCRAMFAHLASFPSLVPFTCCHLVLLDGVPAGGGGFVSPPADGRVELAYFTLPEFEGRGVASALCGELVRLAQLQDPGLALFAKTLPQPCASATILARHGFQRQGSVTDHEIGEAWLWVRAGSP